MKLMREIVGLISIVAGLVAGLVALFAAGWWGLVFLGALALVFGGLTLVVYRPVEVSPEGGEVERQTTS